jgi:hypothetical protein
MPMSFWTIGSSKRRPIRRFTACSVFWEFVTPWRLADWPTSTSSSLVKATIDGVVRSPSLFSITRGLPPSMIATQELVVPRSMPMTLPMVFVLRGIRGPMRVSLPGLWVCLWIIQAAGFTAPWRR